MDDISVCLTCSEPDCDGTDSCYLRHEASTNPRRTIDEVSINQRKSKEMRWYYDAV